MADQGFVDIQALGAIGGFWGLGPGRRRHGLDGRWNCLDGRTGRRRSRPRRTAAGRRCVCAGRKKNGDRYSQSEQNGSHRLILDDRSAVLGSLCATSTHGPIGVGRSLPPDSWVGAGASPAHEQSGWQRKPAEVKRRLGDPGHRLPPAADVVALAPVVDTPPEPPDDLGPAGLRLWNGVCETASVWPAPSDLPPRGHWPVPPDRGRPGRRPGTPPRQHRRHRSPAGPPSCPRAPRRGSGTPRSSRSTTPERGRADVGDLASRWSSPPHHYQYRDSVHGLLDRRHLTNLEPLNGSVPVNRSRFARESGVVRHGTQRHP